VRRVRRAYHVRVAFPDRVETVYVEAFDYVEAEKLAQRAAPGGTSYRAVLVDGAA